MSIEILPLDQLKELAIHAAKGTAPTDFSISSVNEALRDQIKALSKDWNTFQRNKYDIFEIIQEAADTVVPRQVMNTVGMFAEVRQFPSGTKASYTVKQGRQRAKKFLTQVGLSGTYETFRLDTSNFDVSIHAIGGAAAVDFERFLDGLEDLSEYMQIIVEGLENAVYIEIQRALRAAHSVSGFSNNKITVNSFDAEKMAKLCTVVRAYGNGAAIFCTPEFVTDMGADAIVAGEAGVHLGAYSPQDIEDIRTIGWIQIFRGNTIVVLPQSFVDEDNDRTILDPQYAYVLPTGGEKVVKVAIEGNTVVKSYENRDNSTEISAYMRLGTAILAHNNWGSYKNTGITSTYADDMYSI